MPENTDEKIDSQPDTSRSFFKKWQIEFPCFRDHLIFWTIGIVGFLADIWTKKIAFERIRPGQSIPVIEGFFNLVRVVNDGAAFGSLSGKTNYLIAVSCIAALVVIGIFLFGGIKHKTAVVALGLFIAGVLGNLYDRLFNDGMVRDFIDIIYWPGRHWPAFNIADSLLCIGVALLIISAWITEKPCQKHVPEQK
ncbi:MAG: signal peptidase II [Phycisphaerae bacterium]